MFIIMIIKKQIDIHKQHKTRHKLNCLKNNCVDVGTLRYLNPFVSLKVLFLVEPEIFSINVELFYFFHANVAFTFRNFTLELF